jgi:hypothetical protein
LKKIDKKHNEMRVKIDFGNQLSENNENDEIIRKFQKDAIYYSPLMGKSAQAVYIYDEDKYENSKQIGLESSLLGFQVSEKITDNNGLSISYFELGAVVSGIGIPEPIICRYTFPKIGNPGIVNPDRGDEIKNFIHGRFNHIRKSVYDYIIEKRPQFFEEIFSNNFFLIAKRYFVDFASYDLGCTILSIM